MSCWSCLATANVQSQMVNVDVRVNQPRRGPFGPEPSLIFLSV